MKVLRVAYFCIPFLLVFSCQPSTVGADNLGTTTTTTVASTVTTTTLGTTTSTTTTTTVVHGGSPTDTNVAVSISGFAFVQRIIDIAAGGTVTWTNNDASTHTISSTTPPGEVSSGNKTQTQTHSHVFSEAGTYNYRCNIHQSMTGTVIVH